MSDLSKVSSRELQGELARRAHDKGELSTVTTLHLTQEILARLEVAKDRLSGMKGATGPAIREVDHLVAALERGLKDFGTLSW